MLDLLPRRFLLAKIYTLWISRCIATARERIPGSIENYVTGVSERSQQRGNLKDNGYREIKCLSEAGSRKTLLHQHPSLVI
ncbi:hypothetical protein [Photorhabdus sp. S14-60]|uniref:hypothetical protein n=1 Tax=Photorhabdus sp. S14-60 TaxID=2029689 RepID=UPI001314D158|nr:hypothetical protein [Photorhabdus sp. S14-60]NDK93716.1 hypothetical protein [Photorhabdus laumondii subsp. laumondii]